MPLLVRLVAVALVAAVAAGRAPGEIGVAVVRGDRRLQPLARVDGESWTPLAAAEAGALEPLALRRPRGEDVAVRGARGATDHRRRRRAGSACLPATGARPRPTPAAAPRRRQPRHRRAAVARASRCAAPTSGPTCPSTSRPTASSARQLATRAAAAFHRAEDETLTLEAEELPAGFPRFAARRERPVTWTRIVRQGVAQAAAKTYYLEGRKDYDGFRGRTDIGQIRTTGHVFVQMTRRARDDRRRSRSQRRRRRTSRCSATPLAVVGLAGAARRGCSRRAASTARISRSWS